MSGVCMQPMNGWFAMKTSPGVSEPSHRDSVDFTTSDMAPS